ncbi:unnamed protein product [Calicophoron daubneyi]|uniref:Trimethylguanosine synthase n=1 Tax=Calicophoron daubneyi TaxID=300641 RepID=A0AAV2TU75_CALDB
MRHVRQLAELNVHDRKCSLTLIFTRAFIADQFKGVRFRAYDNSSREKVQHSSSEIRTKNNAPCPDAKIDETPASKTRSASEKIVGDEKVYRTRKYLSSMSHALKVLSTEDTSTTDSDCSSEEDSTISVLSSKCSTVSLTVKPCCSHSNDANKNDVNHKSSGDSSSGGSFDLTSELKRLGLPTHFGKNSNTRDDQWEPEEQTDNGLADQLFLLRARQTEQVKSVSGSMRRFVSLPDLRWHLLCDASQRNRSKVSDYTSSDDLIGCAKSVILNLCDLLEISCCFTQDRCFLPAEYNLRLPPCWNLDSFNLEGFLRACKNCWRYRAPISRPSSAKSSSVCMADLVTSDRDCTLVKYWAQRFRLFSRFNEGIMTDRDGLFSATPEAIAAHQARRIVCALEPPGSIVASGGQTVVDACCGVGGNSIQLALHGFNVVAVEVDRVRIAMAQHNAELYGVGEKISFICADLFHWAESELRLMLRDPTQRGKYTALFMSAPWGGPAYLAESTFDLNTISFGDGGDCSASRDFWSAVRLCSQIADGNLVLFLPRNTNVAQLISLSDCIVKTTSKLNRLTTTNEHAADMEIEADVLNFKLKALSVYTGDLCYSRSRLDSKRSVQSLEIAQGTEEFSDIDSDDLYISTFEYSSSSDDEFLTAAEVF